MANPKTTWEDLANLGWPYYDVYRKANEKRDGTIDGSGPGYLGLNEGVAAEFQYASDSRYRCCLTFYTHISDGGHTTRLGATRTSSDGHRLPPVARKLRGLTTTPRTANRSSMSGPKRGAT
jgi:hypothetical protein